jgi:DivIVA domain-containing protein
MSSQRGTIGHVLWFWVVVLVALIGAIAVVAAGRGDSMAEVYDDRPDSILPTGRPLTAEDLAALRLNTGVRGYRMDEVDALLARLQAEMISRDEDHVRVLTRDENDRAEPAPAPGTPPVRSDERPDVRPGERTEERTEEQPDVRSEERPDEPPDEHRDREEP